MKTRPRILRRRSGRKDAQDRVQIPIEREGALTDLGYSVKLPPEDRQKVIDKAVDKYGALSVFKMLKAMEIMRKTKQQKYRDDFADDADYVDKKYLEAEEKPFSLKDVSRKIKLPKRKG